MSLSPYVPAEVQAASCGTVVDNRFLFVPAHWQIPDDQSGLPAGIFL